MVTACNYIRYVHSSFTHPHMHADLEVRYGFAGQDAKCAGWRLKEVLVEGGVNVCLVNQKDVQIVGR